MPDLWLPRQSRREFLRAAGVAGAAAALPWPTGAAQAPAPLFEAVPASRSGITWRHDNAMSEFRYLPETCGSGCAFLDYDNDGWMDVYLVNSGPSDFHTPASPVRNALYRNNRDGTFTDVTDRAGVPGGTFGMGVAVGDYDNDGFADLFVTAYGNCTLYRNNGNGTFTDVTDKAGLRTPGWTTSAAWFDFDNDGRLDLFVCSFVEFSLKTNVFCGDNKLGRRYYCIPRVFKPSSSFLYRNNGDGTFTEGGRGTDIQRALGKALGVVATDVDKDGALDLFVANDTVQNFLFMNRGAGRWEEIGLASEVGFSANGQPRSGMGVDAADFDQDGWQDLFVANVDQEMFSLYKNRGNESFQDVAHANGVAQSTRLMSGWGLKFFDYDNDGRLDVLINNNGGAPLLLQNHAGQDHHWVGLVLQGTTCNRDAIGARISWSAGGRITRRLKTGGGSYLSAHDPRDVLGLGPATTVDWVEIAWPAPSKRVDRLTSLKIDTYHRVVEGQSAVFGR